VDRLLEFMKANRTQRPGRRRSAEQRHSANEAAMRERGRPRDPLPRRAPSQGLREPHWAGLLLDYVRKRED
jgi:hypothetical protein